MSELKRHHINEVMDMHNLTRGEMGYSIVYYADDADKVIAELKSDIADLRDDKKLTNVILDERNAEIAELEDKLQAANEQIENLINSASSIMLFQDRVKDDKCAEIRHHKHKRCLAMAKWCESEAYIHEHGSEYDEDLVAWFGKWHKRWLELAEKFKEAE